jgi:hypothetical protein
MLEFLPLENNLDILKKYLPYEKSGFCELSVGVKFAWRKVICTKYAVVDNTLILKESSPVYKDTFYFPLGENVQNALSEIESYCIQKGLPLLYCCLDQEQLSFLNDSVIKGYGGYIYAVAELHDERQAESDIGNYQSFVANDFVKVREFMGSLGEAIEKANDVVEYTRSSRCFRRGCRMGRFFEVKNFKDGHSVWGWIGAYYNYGNNGDPEICVWFEDRPGWGKLVCDKFRDKYSGDKPKTDTWYYRGEGGHLYFYMLDSDKDISTFFNRVLEEIRSDNISSCKLEIAKVKETYEPLLSMRRFPLWIERNFFNNLQIDDCVVIVDAGGDSEDPYNHCGRYFTIEKQLKQNCGGKKQQLKGWVGVLFGENENAIEKPQIEVQFLQENGKYECEKCLSECGSDKMSSIASEFQKTVKAYCKSSVEQK